MTETLWNALCTRWRFNKQCAALLNLMNSVNLARKRACILLFTDRKIINTKNYNDGDIDLCCTVKIIKCLMFYSECKMMLWTFDFIRFVRLWNESFAALDRIQLQKPAAPFLLSKTDFLLLQLRGHQATHHPREIPVNSYFSLNECISLCW